MLALRFGPMADVSGRISSEAASNPLDLCWDEQWRRVLHLGSDGKQTVLRAYSSDGKERSAHPLPGDLLAGSRLFRRGSSICLLAGDYTPKERRFLLTLHSLGSRFEQAEIDLRSDCDENLAPILARQKRNALVALNPDIPLPDPIDPRTGRTGSLADKIILLRHFPVNIGHPNKPDVRFGSSMKTLAMAINPLPVGWVHGGIWHKQEMRGAVVSRVSKRLRRAPLSLRVKPREDLSQKTAPRTEPPRLRVSAFYPPPSRSA